jgi:hypothetical protein
VKGAAGNDIDIVEFIDTIEKFTATYTVNETGFCVLEATQRTSAIVISRPKEAKLTESM